MTGSRQVSSGVRQRLSAPRGHRFSRPGANRPLAAPPPPREHRHSGPYFSTPETHSERQARLLRQMEGNPRVAHMLQHGPTPHWFEVDRQRRAQEEREARRLEEALAALTDDAPATPARGRHRAPRRWRGWPAVAVSTTLLLAQTTAQALGQALFQTGPPPL